MLYILLVIAVLAVLQGAAALWSGVAFLRFVRRELAAPEADPAAVFAPRATVLLPCKGVDTKLYETLRAVVTQDYPHYEVICAVESRDDPAFAVIERAARSAGRAPLRCVVASLSEGCSQKIANLLAALETVHAESRVYALLDSDAVPHSDWLASLVRPLADPAVGAVTGFRWYVPSGSAVSMLRCIWNAQALTFLGDHSRNFCWGGSTAVRRETFEQLDIANRWRTVLSEDYEITRSMHEAGLEIRFAPRCLIPSDDEVTWSDFWRFARRQLLITRVCHPPFWKAGVTMTIVFSAAFWGTLLGGLLELTIGRPERAALLLLLNLLIYALAAMKGYLRSKAVALLLPHPSLRSGATLADVLGAPPLALYNIGLLTAAGISNRFWWRNVLYEMRSVNETIVLERRSEPADSPRARAAADPTPS